MPLAKSTAKGGVTYYRILQAEGHVACFPSCAEAPVQKSHRHCSRQSCGVPVSIHNDDHSPVTANKFEDAVTYECHSFDGAPIYHNSTS